MRARVQHDLLYNNNWSICLDIRISLLTALKAGLISLVMSRFAAHEDWAAWMNGVFGLVYLVSAAFTYRLLGQATSGARP